MRSTSLLVAILSTAMAVQTFGQTAPPAAPPVPTPAASLTSAPAPPSASSRLISSIRNKLSAGDLLSAESLAEVYLETHTDDGAYLQGLAWVARGALLLGEYDRAGRYVAEVRRRCDARLSRGAHLDADDSLETALGAVIEVEAQLRARDEGKSSAARFLRDELAKVPGPVALRSRINKRLNMLTLAGTAAPELVVEDYVGDVPPSLASLRGRPVLLFVWAEGCGDCRAQEASLARVTSRYADRGLQVVALTRYYDPGDHAVERARVDSVWTTVYATMGRVPIVISTASMERYGGSSTPTFVTIDKAGLVRWYTPTRLTEAELDRAVAELFE
jgi:thiol-disulfide isomerase/thioredoxin